MVQAVTQRYLMGIIRLTRQMELTKQTLIVLLITRLLMALLMTLVITKLILMLLTLPKIKLIQLILQIATQQILIQLLILQIKELMTLKTLRLKMKILLILRIALMKVLQIQALLILMIPNKTLSHQIVLKFLLKMQHNQSLTVQSLKDFYNLVSSLFRIRSGKTSNLIIRMHLISQVSGTEETLV